MINKKSKITNFEKCIKKLMDKGIFEVEDEEKKIILKNFRKSVNKGEVAAGLDDATFGKILKDEGFWNDNFSMTSFSILLKEQFESLRESARKEIIINEMFKLVKNQKSLEQKIRKKIK